MADDVESDDQWLYGESNDAFGAEIENVHRDSVTDPDDDQQGNGHQQVHLFDIQ